MELAAGVDSSTQSTKVELRDIETGALVAAASAPHPPTSPPVSEQDPLSWWSALETCFAELNAHATDVRAMSVAGQQHGLVLLDEAGSPLRPAKLWNDTTSAAQAERLTDGPGGAWWARECGSVPVAAFTITKLAWVLENEPEIAERVAKVMLPHDYLTWRLTAQHVTDRGDASGTGWFNPSTNQYEPELLATVAGANDWIDRLPTVVQAGQTVGSITGEAAEALGLSSDVIVGPGTGDNMAAALGLGLGSGDVALSLGTSGTVYGVSDTGTHDPTGSVAGFADATGRFLPLVCTLNATKVTDTVARWLGTDAPGLATLAMRADASAIGPVLVPYFDGERTPNRPDATGTFAALRNDTTREALALAAHDGVLCGLLDGLDALTAAGVAATGSLHLIGGGSRSTAYRQRSADLHQAPVIVPHTDETVATGAAVQAAVVAGAATFDDMSEAWGLGAGDVIEPAADTSGIRDRYREASQA